VLPAGDDRFALRRIAETSPVRNDWQFAKACVVLANPDLIGKLGVAVPLSIPGWASIVGSLGRCFRFLPEPCGASA